MEPARPDEPGASQDAQTIGEVLTEFETEGYGGQLVPLEGGHIRVAGTGETFDAADARVADCRRLEGTSDPADEVLVVAVDLPDGSKGSLVLSYGMNASPSDGDVLLRLDVPA